MEHRRACWCVDISARMHTDYKYHIWTLILSLISDTKLACGPDKVWYSCLVWQFGAFAGSSWSSYRCGLVVSPLFPAIRLTHTHTHTGPKVFTALFFLPPDWLQLKLLNCWGHKSLLWEEKGSERRQDHCIPAYTHTRWYLYLCEDNNLTLNLIVIYS